MSDWEAAEKIAFAYAARSGETPNPRATVRHLRIPHYFKVALESGWSHVLVHEGKVVGDRGLAALASYLRAVGALEAGRLEADDMTVLVTYFEALPPVKEARPNEYARPGKLPGLEPALAATGDALTFTLCYLVTARRRGGGAARPSERDVERWTLTVRAAGEPTWSSSRVRYDVEKRALVP